MWEDCIEIFPKPAGQEGELDLLNSMWLEVEKNAPKKLDKLQVVVERYVKRYFHDFKYLEMEKLLDQVQRKCPDFICDLYKKGTEMMMLNLVPSQYSLLISYLRVRKRDREKALTHLSSPFKGG